MKNIIISKEDNRLLSDKYAKVVVNGIVDTIERHYEKVKYTNGRCTSKGQLVTDIKLLNRDLDPKYLTAFYTLLWVKYLDNNPKLVIALKEDINSKGYNLYYKVTKDTIDIIRQYINNGRKSIMSDILIKEFISILR